MAEGNGWDLSPDIQEAIRKLAESLAARDEVKELKAARAELDRHEAARIMLRDLRQRERRLAERQMAGEKISDQELEELRQVAGVVGFNPYVRALLEAELRYATLMAGIQRALEEALGFASEPPDGEGDASGQQEAAGRGKVEPARSRLWVPGQP
ncbi:MAG: YlbF family regulator [Limnochordaceae bacterium]|nr:YlbF family regulator [Limnochordaceae bacterium]